LKYINDARSHERKIQFRILLLSVLGSLSGFLGETNVKQNGTFRTSF